MGSRQEALRPRRFCKIAMLADGREVRRDQRCCLSVDGREPACHLVEDVVTQHGVCLERPALQRSAEGLRLQRRDKRRVARLLFHREQREEVPFGELLLLGPL